jgi:hypothetical protein
MQGSVLEMTSSCSSIIVQLHSDCWASTVGMKTYDILVVKMNYLLVSNVVIIESLEHLSLRPLI